MFFPNSQQFLESALPQEFSFPKPFMKYIWENASSPGVYKKLIQSGKLFFIKNPILILKNLYYTAENEWKYCDKDECYCCTWKHKTVDFDKLSGQKIWISKEIRVSTISKSNTNVELKRFFAGMPAHSTCKSYDDFIAACQTIKEIVFNGIHADFNVPQFYQHLKQSKNRCIFKIFVSNDHERLKGVVDEIVATESFEFIPPLIYYGYFSGTMNKKMEDIQATEAAKYQ